MLLLSQLNVAAEGGINNIIVEPGDSTIGEVPSNWHLLDLQEDNYRGISLIKAYNTILKGKKSERVLVAVIDSGIDIEHEDLDDIIWVNEDEIPDNNIDDDNNGYVDDIHGWNFLGGKDGKNIDNETFELTRELARLEPIYKDVNKSDLSGKKLEEFRYYQELNEAYEEEMVQANNLYENYNQILTSFKEAKEILSDELEGKELSLEVIQNLSIEGEQKERAKNILFFALSNQLTEEELEGAVEYVGNQKNYWLKKGFNPREIVGDDLSNLKEKGYGNNDVIGPDAEHGTHVAGIIAAERNNKLGVDGIADNVQIMVIRAVPNGDERDKDVANAIYYAVNNGAQVVNMSFGKSYSPNKKIVDKAVKYAQKKGVLLIHASGNDGIDIDVEDNFPTKHLKKSHSGKVVKNWIEVGASSWESSGNFAANFSNYGDNSVDVFAPGVQIYSTIPDQKYKNNNGTSMAAPAVTGLAALLLSYYPDLDYQDVKEIIVNSATSLKEVKVKQPGTDAMIPFGKLSETGGIINVYEAISMAEKQYN